MADEKMIMLKPGIVVQHKKKVYKNPGKRPSIPESAVKEMVSAKRKIPVDDKDMKKYVSDWVKKYGLTEDKPEPEAADVDSDLSKSSGRKST